MLYSKGGTTGIAKLIDIDEEFANWVHVAVLKFDKSKLNGIFFENMLNGDYCFEQSQRLTKGIANRECNGADKDVSSTNGDSETIRRLRQPSRQI